MTERAKQKSKSSKRIKQAVFESCMDACKEAILVSKEIISELHQQNKKVA